jgi:hypothetical protein
MDILLLLSSELATKLDELTLVVALRSSHNVLSSSLFKNTLILAPISCLLFFLTFLNINSCFYPVLLSTFKDNRFLPDESLTIKS